MLEELRIRGLGVIDDAVLELGPGLTVLTGETGAGKTMVVHGLSLLTGARSDPGLVRPGVDRALVEGRVVVSTTGPAARRAAEAGGELDVDDTPDGPAVLVVSRTLGADGVRSRAHVGGRTVPLAVLSEVCDSLVALHGQHDQQRLRSEAEQRALLDRYAGEPVGIPLSRYRSSYARWQEVTAEIADITARHRERAQEADLIRHGLAEVAAAAPRPGEDAELAAEVARLAHADTLRTAAAAAQRALTGDPADPAEVDAASAVGRARAALAAAAGLDPTLDDHATRLVEASHLLAEVGADLSTYADGLEADPVRLDHAQERQAVLLALTRKHATDVGGVLEWVGVATARLAVLEADDDRVDLLRAEQSELESRLGSLAAEVSAARRTAATRLAAGVTAELGALSMPDAVISVGVEARVVETGGLVVEGRRLACSRDGVDTVEMLLTPHVGAPARPVARGASGGELSRVMLAVEVVLAEADPVPTMVFDEVDAGVGGRAAVEIGRRLARLARTHQVLVVTHLPQVAAFADRHLRVVKSDAGGVTGSDVVALDDGERVVELSRMLAGIEESALARGHAEELLAAAAADKGAGTS